MEYTMPYRKILMNTFSNWLQSKVVWLQGIMLWIMSVDFFEGVKLYAVLIGAAYTTIKFYKDFVREHEYWLAFKKVGIEMLKAVADVARQKKEADENKEKEG